MKKLYQVLVVIDDFADTPQLHKHLGGGCGLTAGTCELDHGAGEAGLCGQRANSAGAVRRLPQQEDAARERAAHQPREPRGPRSHGVRLEPQAASSGF